MASLNLSTNGPSISKSYKSVVDAPAPSGAAASSPTYAQWAVFSVSAPLASAFQDSGNKESVLKVQATGEGELVDLIDEFSDGRIQFAFVKVKDSNSGLPKNALIGWCGEGVPERTKGYFTSHSTAVAKLLHGYHVQITARSDRDLTPEGIVQKVADASGSKYSTSSSAPAPVASTKPPVASKAVFTPTQSSSAGGYNSLASRATKPKDQNVDEDGWGNDAPQVTRTQLEKVSSAYQPTKVNMRELTSQKPASSAYSNDSSFRDTPDVVRGAYQPIGKVDIAAIRRQAKESGSGKVDRPEIVKGSYEPVGKVDIAAIRARAQKPEGASPEPVQPSTTGQSDEAAGSSPSLAQRSAAFSSGPERLTSLPKPKIANKFGGGSSFTGTKAPLPGAFEAKPSTTAAPVGLASRTFADQGGKTPAQIWAEKKARERGSSGSGTGLPPSGFTGQLPVQSQPSGSKEWESGYAGKKWGAVSTTYTGKSAGSSIDQQRTGEAPVPVQEEEEEEEEEAQQPAATSPVGGVSSIRDRFSGAAPMGAPAPSTYDRAPPPPAPAPETSTKPNRGIPIPGLSSASRYEDDAPVAQALPTPPQQPRSPTPPTPEARDTSPIRVAVPVSRTHVADAHREQSSPPPALPTSSINRAVPDVEDDEPESGPDPARTTARTAAVDAAGPAAASTASKAGSGGKRATAEYDYDAAEDNEVSLREGEIVTDVQEIDPDWWLVTNAQGQQGLVPSNYLSPLDGDEPAPMSAPSPEPTPAPTAASTSASTTRAPAPAPAASRAPTATAQYDYEAGEDNEISFPENAIITNIEFPDDDWWHGEYQGKSGLFPAAYVTLDPEDA